MASDLPLPLAPLPAAAPPCGGAAIGPWTAAVDAGWGPAQAPAKPVTRKRQNRAAMLARNRAGQERHNDIDKSPQKNWRDTRSDQNAPAANAFARLSPGPSPGYKVTMARYGTIAAVLAVMATTAAAAPPRPAPSKARPAKAETIKPAATKTAGK